MKVHAYASMAHYARHIAPILAALPDELRGEMYAPGRKPWGGPALRGRIDGPVIVAGYSDAQTLWRNRLIYVEHGAGQSYKGDSRSATHASYSGGASPIFAQRVALFLCPGPRTAARWQAAYPDVPAVAVGAPWLDEWHAGRRHPTDRPTTVALTFHWPCNLIPETQSALKWYEPGIAELKRRCDADGIRLLGHGHPRIYREIEDRLWGRHGIGHTPNPEDVLDRADLLVVDNSSFAYEFASTGRPVLTLNAPWYRRDVHHGLRFWDFIPGLAIADPADLYNGIRASLADPPEARRLRAAAVQEVYSRLCDSHAAERAAHAIEEVVNAESLRSEPAGVARGRVRTRP